MSEIKMSDDDIIYCLENLAGYDSSDIDCDDVDIACGDDQFCSMSIVRTAQLGAELANRLTNENSKLTEQNAKLVEFVESLASAKVYSVEIASQYGGEDIMDCLCDSWKEKANQLLTEIKGQEGEY